MKKLQILAIVFLTTMSVYGESIEDANLAEQEIVSITEVTKDFLQEYFSEGSNLILFCPKDAQLPISLFLLGDILSFAEGGCSQELKVKTSFYIKYDKAEAEGFLFSLDCKNWKLFREFFTGRINLNLGDAPTPNLKLSLDINQRN